MGGILRAVTLVAKLSNNNSMLPPPTPKKNTCSIPINTIFEYICIKCISHYLNQYFLKIQCMCLGGALNTGLVEGSVNRIGKQNLPHLKGNPPPLCH